MKSFFKKDLKVEMEVSRFIDQYLYPYLSKKFERQMDKDSQSKGIDVKLYLNNETMFVDDKCAIYFANQDLKTFAFELSYLYQDYERTGWFLKDLSTTHYNLMWLTTKDKSIQPQDITSEDINEIESMIISKSKLTAYLNKIGLKTEKLKQLTNHIRRSNNEVIKLNEHIRIQLSKKLAEKPVNLIINKSVLSNIADYHLKVIESRIWDCKNKKDIKRIDNNDYTPGESAELTVYHALEKFSAGREHKNFHRFSIHNYKNQRRREIDVLMVDKEYGVTVIEVKGVNINQIDSIKNGIWYFNHYDVDPFKQGEEQLNKLCNQLDKAHPSLFKKYTKRVLVALPNITISEWKAKGFDKIKNLPPILFKDHINQVEKIKELFVAHIYRANQPLDEKHWAMMKKFFSIEDNNNDKLTEKYSVLYVFPSEHDFLREKRNIVRKLQEGIKVFLLCYFDIKKSQSPWLNELENFVDAFQLQYFTNIENNGLTKTIIIKDGTKEIPKRICADFPDFNERQYRTVHIPINQNIMVTAGAGTGKTHVMVDRILYLLSNGISLKDIIMITFTNKSTEEMKSRLQKKLIELSKLTGKTKFGLYAEDVKDMQISTIHSFSKTILKKLAHVLGLGRSFSIRNFTYEKRVIIRELIDEFYKNNRGSEKIDQLLDYQLENVILKFWDEIEKKGLSKDEMKNLDWGNTAKRQHNIFNQLFEFVFQNCEEKLDEIKKNENALSTNDLIRKIKEFENNKEKLKQLEVNKYLFMDEFQDSDNVQIDLVASLAKYLNYKLFVVGDVKQSIYRFRGADYRSFDLLDDKLISSNGESVFKKITLSQNYRTNSSLLDKLDELFVKWGEKEWLSYDEKLQGMKKKESQIGEFKVISCKKEKLDNILAEEVAFSRKQFEKLPKDENRKIALLVRTNNHALEMEKICRKLKIPTATNLDGTFYKSEAVRDFKRLLDGLMYPNDAKHLVNALHSPYFGYKIPYKTLLKYYGDNQKIVQFIKQKIGMVFHQYVDQIKIIPVMAVIQKIITEKGLFQNLQHFYEDGETNTTQQRININQYRKNLFHLMNIIQQQFDTASTTLYSIYQWLTLMMRTNRSENEPMLDLNEDAVEITTVHRAKGLEYHTVIIPKTTYGFGEKKWTKFYIQDEEEMKPGQKRKVGWYIKELKSHSSHYEELSKYDWEEVFKEETRLLYVAMTRAKSRLIVLLPSNHMDNTWSEIIRETGVEVTPYAH